MEDKKVKFVAKKETRTMEIATVWEELIWELKQKKIDEILKIRASAIPDEASHREFQRELMLDFLEIIRRDSSLKVLAYRMAMELLSEELLTELEIERGAEYSMPMELITDANFFSTLGYLAKCKQEYEEAM